MIIFQIDRTDLTGRKNATTTQFQLKLDRLCQHLVGCKGAEHELQTVIVHQGNATKGHYITFLKPSGDPHWALFDDDTVQWVQEKGVLDQEATILVYTRPDCMVENETITIPDDGQEDGSPPLERGETRINHPGSATTTTGGNTLEKQGRREPAENTLQPPAPSNLPEMGDHFLYRELLERAHQDPTTQERDLEEAMTGTPNKERQLQEDAKQVQELRAFQDYLHEHGLRETESTVDLTPEAPPLAQTPEVPTTGRPHPVQIGILYLLSSTLSRCDSLKNLGNGRRVRRRKSN
jgi:hypothetical protein